MFDDDMEEIRQIFLEESYEGLDIMESGLLRLDTGEADPETVNDIFRAAHSIKGGGSTFGFDEVAEFTHGVETLLDQIRSGARSVSSEVVQLLLQSVDCLREMMQAIKDNVACKSEQTEIVQARISEILESTNQAVETTDAVSGSPADMVQNHIDEMFNTGEPDESGQPVEINESEAPIVGWQILFQPDKRILVEGNEPLNIFSELESLGDLTVEVDSSALPNFDNFEPENCYLSWNLCLRGDVTREQVVSVFEWVEDHCKLEITPLFAEVEATSQTETSSSAGSLPVGKPETERVLQIVPDVEDRRKSEDRRQEDRRSSSASTESSSIRVKIEKLDSLLDLVGELVITQSSLNRFGKEDHGENQLAGLQDGLVQLERNARELQESAMQVRMLPIKMTFSRFPRLVHDLSTKLNKKVELQIEGEQTELDKTVLEKVGDPLVHLVRNSLDHGIETVEERIKAGKPEVGIMRLSAHHEAGDIVIEVFDDGAGLNKERILAKARERGLVGEDEQLSDDAINNLIFQAGFSTAETVTDVSGRGVGMDVVRRNIMDLGGRVEVRSEQGKGSRFTIRLPLTLAILDGQLVDVDGDTYVIPLLSITESVLIDENKINLIIGKAPVYQFRNESIPVIILSEVCNISSKPVSSTRKNLNNKLLVVVETDGRLVGLVVDGLLEQQQVVIKSLETNFKRVEGLSGATILGDGSVALILDIPGVVKSCFSGEKILAINSLEMV